ncbi:Membrane protein [Globisporangium polare]
MRPTSNFIGAWQQTFGYTGLFGVHSKHFTLVFLAREVTEAILESVQAWSPSYYVPRIWLNRFAVAVVVFGCWSTPSVQHFRHKNPRPELILCLLLDDLERYMSNREANKMLRDLSALHRQELDFLYWCMEFVHSHSGRQAWYVFWDDFFARNGKMTVVAEHAANLDPMNLGSICYRVVPRAALRV